MWEGTREGENEREINYVVAISPKMPLIAFLTGLCELLAQRSFSLVLMMIISCSYLCTNVFIYISFRLSFFSTMHLSFL